MFINYKTTTTNKKIVGNKTIETTVNTTEKVEINEEEIFEIRKYDGGVWVVAPKGSPMPERVITHDHHSGESYEMVPDYSDTDFYPEAAEYSVDCNRNAAIEWAYFIWRNKQ